VTDDGAVPAGYTHGNLLGAIEADLEQLDKNSSTVSVEDLGPVDEFHIGGRVATERFLADLDISEEHHVLDVGCGLGGAAPKPKTIRACRRPPDSADETVTAGDGVNE
jgi:hypothetical protein